MATKIARPTDNAGKVMWNAAVVANCHRDRSMKVCDVIFFRVPSAVQTARQTQAEQGRAGSMARSGRGPGRQRSHAIRAPITTTMAQSRPFLIPADGQSGYQLAGVPAWLSAGCRFSEMVPAPTTVRHKRLFTKRTVVHAPIQGNPASREDAPGAGDWPAQCRWPLPGAANCSTIRAQNAGRSSGQRLEVMFWSVTTSWSTTLPPALRMSVL